jgi:hypothetical protein
MECCVSKKKKTAIIELKSDISFESQVKAMRAAIVLYYERCSEYGYLIISANKNKFRRIIR